MSIRPSWHPWKCRQWPCSNAEEATFVADLRHFARQPHPRDDTPMTGEVARAYPTMLLGALRSGLSAQRLLEECPGLAPSRLVRVYDELEAARADAVRAWRQLAADPRLEVLLSVSARAATLIPVPVYRAAEGVGATPGDVAAGVAAADELVRAASRRVQDLEARMATAPTPQSAQMLGAQLFRPHAETLWTHPYFAPSRVGQLSPRRLANLLGETD